MNIFRLKIRFPPWHSTLYPIFFETVVFICDFFLIRFYRSPPHILLETKRFASIEDSLGFSVLCDLPETFSVFSPVFRVFLRGVQSSKMFFLLFPVGEKVIFESYAYPFG